jgi:hypothetical protein
VTKWRDLSLRHVRERDGKAEEGGLLSIRDRPARADGETVTLMEEALLTRSDPDLM